MSRSYRSSFAATLFTGYAEPKVETVIDRFPPIEPPPKLSAQLQLAMFTLLSRKGSQIAKDILGELRKSTVLAGANEYSELMRLGYAVRERGSVYHELTPKGRFQGDRMAKIAALELGIHGFRVWRDHLHNHIACTTCSWRYSFPAAAHHVKAIQGRRMAEHLEEMGRERSSVVMGRERQQEEGRADGPP